MLKSIHILVGLMVLSQAAPAQNLKEKEVPEPVRTSFQKTFPKATKVSWEKEKANFESNWGGKSGEDHSALFTPAGDFLELVDAIPVSQLPGTIVPYISEHYKGATIREAGKVTNARGIKTYEVEIKGKDLIFDDQGHFLKED